MSKIYFVRHGESQWNVEDKICGQTDIPLTERGHAQAEETGRRIVEKGITAAEILCSPLLRAKDTAAHISQVTGIPLKVEPRLTEQNFGIWELLPESVNHSVRQRKSFSAGTRQENPCFSWHRGFIICWMN